MTTYASLFTSIQTNRHPFVTTDDKSVTQKIIHINASL